MVNTVENQQLWCDGSFALVVIFKDYIELSLQ